MGAALVSGESVLSAATQGNVVVLAGRRVDSADAEVARFPLANAETVRARLRESFARITPVTLVASAACGSDLIAQDLARETNIERIVVLPSDPVKFRASSVVDRPGDWGSMFDRLAKEVKLEVVDVPEGDAGYLEANIHLLDRAESVARGRGVPVTAMAVWDKISRGADDVTGHFLEQARLRKFPVLEISTL